MRVTFGCRSSSDGSDDEDNGSGAVYDYELETAKKAQAARDDTSSGVLDLARETIGGMSERLQSETEVCRILVGRTGEVGVVEGFTDLEKLFNKTNEQN